MTEKEQQLEAINDIRRIMDKSSRFISLSGWSGVAAGCAAIAGAVAAWSAMDGPQAGVVELPGTFAALTGLQFMTKLAFDLLLIGFFTFTAAFFLAFLFTWLRSRKTGIPVWGRIAKKLIVAVSIPMIIGGIFLFRVFLEGNIGLIAPGCLIFYGLALINASRYTLSEIRYLGYFQLILGAVNLWFTGYGLYFWAMGFGVFHIIYGIIMWMKYEKQSSVPTSKA